MRITFLVFVFVAADQILKYIAAANLKDAGSIIVIPGLLELIYIENRGAAFGILQNQRWFFIIFAVTMILAFVYLINVKKINNKIFLTSAVLIIAGGLGNFIDRLFLGYVIDYIKLSFFPPVCNFADYCITFGVVILTVYILFFYNKKDALK